MTAFIGRREFITAARGGANRMPPFRFAPSGCLARFQSAALSHCSLVQTNNFRGPPTDADHRQHIRMLALFVGARASGTPRG